MKMQNVDLELISFDAQDVIATSGPSFTEDGKPLYLFSGLGSDRKAPNGDDLMITLKSTGEDVTSQFPVGTYYIAAGTSGAMYISSVEGKTYSELMDQYAIQDGDYYLNSILGTGPETKFCPYNQ